eukprot:14899789-Alexandrium_andersonii.AAC.1
MMPRTHSATLLQTLQGSKTRVARELSGAPWSLVGASMLSRSAKLLNAIQMGSPKVSEDLEVTV